MQEQETEALADKLEAAVKVKEAKRQLQEVQDEKARVLAEHVEYKVGKAQKLLVYSLVARFVAKDKQLSYMATSAWKQSAIQAIQASWKKGGLAGSKLAA